MDDGFQALLRKIQEDNLPDYGSLRLSGEGRQITETFQLQRPGEERAAAKGRLLRYLEQLTEDERAAAEIEIGTKGGAPYLLTIKGKTGDLPAARLQALRERAESPAGDKSGLTGG